MGHEEECARSLCERFEREQDDLDALCAPREAPSGELWLGNLDYGSATVLKRYAGVSLHTAVRAVIPHGIYFNAEPLSSTERDSGMPAVMVFPEYRARTYLTGTSLFCIPSASPFVYADRLIRCDGPREGTLFFLAHSTPAMKVETDWEALADQLLAWPEHMAPVTIMVYWQDYVLNHHLPFARRGLSVVSAGHPSDQDFLLRQAYLLRRSKYAASNGVGSYIFYAVQSGCPFHFFGGGYDYVPWNPALQHTIGDTSVRVSTDGDLAIFSEWSDTTGDEQRALSDYYLGTENTLSSRDMRRLLRWLLLLDLLGQLAMLLPDAKRFRVRWPEMVPILPSALRRMRSRIRAIGRRLSG